MDKSDSHPYHALPDIRAGIVVFFVALPLCLGIALASGAPLLAGVITGIVGGMLVALLSGSSLAVSGPAAGLTVIILATIERLGSYEAFLLAGFVAGIFQIILGYSRAGKFRDLIPRSVIYGMLAGIGLIVLLKQIPHLLGTDETVFGYLEFFELEGRNTFTSLLYALSHIEPGATLVGILSLITLGLWELPIIRKTKVGLLLPGALVVVLLGVGMNQLFAIYFPVLYIDQSHLVTLPVIDSTKDFWQAWQWPDFSQWNNPMVYISALLIAVVASVETLLSLDATDTLDPRQRHSPPNRELKAQGIGNCVSTLLGGISMTAVIIRSTANINAGAQSKLSAFYHGVLLLLALWLIPEWINLIPLASLAAILIQLGYKLTKPRLFKQYWRLGYQSFIPFIITVSIILLSDLLIGITVGFISHYLLLFIRLWIRRRNRGKKTPLNTL
jgi:MFS superfamily sulfate permease-like transporter